MYVYSYPEHMVDGWWWHQCRGLGAWARVWRNGQLPVNTPADWTPQRLCPWCDLEGIVRVMRMTREGHETLDPFRLAMFYLPEEQRWHVLSPEGGARPFSW
jgi:hypothetical protein